MSAKSNNRILELDALRGLAALAVVLFHYTTKYSEIFNTDVTTQIIDFKYGHYGVQLFFIISGFVIFMTINKVKTPFEFIFKRFIRLYPVFWLCIIITTLVTFNLPPGFGRSFSDLVVSFTMIPALLGYKPIDGAYWSLVPELFFYAMILGIFLLKKLDKIVWIGFVWIGFNVVISNEFYSCNFWSAI